MIKVTQSYELTWYYEVDDEDEALRLFSAEIQDAANYWPISDPLAEAV